MRLEDLRGTAWLLLPYRVQGSSGWTETCFVAEVSLELTKTHLILAQ